MVDQNYFTTDDGVRFRPTPLARGPWDPDACHAGPPTGLVARCAEALLPHQRLVRLTAEIVRPIPFDGFDVVGGIDREGRTASTTEVTVLHPDGKPVVTARCLHITPGDIGDVPTAPTSVPSFGESAPGDFPVRSRVHDLTMFRDSAEVRYDEGHDGRPGPTTLWMRTPPLLPDETPTPFQRICPLADCGNAFSRNADLDEIGFVNADLTIAIHREPIGDWLGSSSTSHWYSDGVGLADAILFDQHGPVGRALQMLVLRRLDR